jgi:hypothetical protein
MRAGLRLGGSEPLTALNGLALNGPHSSFGLAAWINESITARLTVHSTPKN